MIGAGSHRGCVYQAQEAALTGVPNTEKTEREGGQAEADKEEGTEQEQTVLEGTERTKVKREKNSRKAF